MATAEYKIFIQSFDKIVTALSSNLTDIAGKLVARELIPLNHYDKIVTPVPGITEKQRAGQLASHIGDVVKISPQKFTVFVKILRGDPYCEDVVKHLEDCLQKHHGECCCSIIRLDLDVYFKSLTGAQSGAAESSFYNVSESRQPESQVSFGSTDADQCAVTIEEMQRKFGLLVTKTLKSIEKKKISVEEFATTLLALGAYEPVLDKEERLLEDHEDELFQARSISDVYCIIRPYMSFFNPELMDYIIKAHGTPENHEQLQAYMSELKTFCQSISVPPRVDLGENESIESRGKIIIKILEDQRLDRIRDVKSAIAKILGISKAALYLKSVEDGSMELIFLVPVFIIQNEFPLPKERYDSFCSLGALTLTAVYGGIHQYHIDFQTTVRSYCNRSSIKIDILS